MTADTTPLRFQEKLGYGLGDTASNFFFQVFNLFLLYYYTDVFGLAPAAVGTMFLVTKIVDAISDPIMGLVADRTDSRWGKFRPYLLWAAIPYGLCGYAMFFSPDLSATGKLVYAYATYTLMMLIYTVINVPYSALMGVISPVSAERTKVASYRFICAFSAGWLIATFVTPLKNQLGGGNEELGFRLTMMIFAVISILLFWMCFAATKERVHPDNANSNVRSDLRTLLGNGPWIALFFSGIFALTNVAMRGGATIFYFKYYVGDDGTPIFLIFDKTAVFLSLSTFALIGGVMMTQFLCKRFDKRHLMIALTVANAVAMSAFYFIPPEQYWLMVASRIPGYIHCRTDACARVGDVCGLRRLRRMEVGTTHDGADLLRCTIRAKTRPRRGRRTIGLRPVSFWFRVQRTSEFDIDGWHSTDVQCFSCHIGCAERRCDHFLSTRRRPGETD